MGWKGDGACNEELTLGSEVLARLLVDDEPLAVADSGKLPELVDVGDAEGLAVLPGMVSARAQQHGRGGCAEVMEGGRERDQKENDKAWAYEWSEETGGCLPAVDDLGSALSVLVEGGLAIDVEEGVEARRAGPGSGVGWVEVGRHIDDCFCQLWNS